MAPSYNATIRHESAQASFGPLGWDGTVVCAPTQSSRISTLGPALNLIPTSNSQPPPPTGWQNLHDLDFELANDIPPRRFATKNLRKSIDLRIIS